MIDGYFDYLGLPVTKNGDGGDSAAEAGTIIALTTEDINVWHYLPTRGPVRHPDMEKWYGREGRFSRDQLVALLCGLCMRSEYASARDILFEFHKNRWFVTAWNVIRNFVYDSLEEHNQKSTPDVPYRREPKAPDFTGPEVWALWIRAYRKRWLWPLLCILDLETLFGAVTWLWRKDGISRNHLLVCFVSTSVMPTPISWLARIVTPVKDMIPAWGEHCRRTGAIDTSPLFREAFKR